MILLEVDPNLVKPGWMPLIVTTLLAVAVILLFFSMRKQFRKIKIEPTETEKPEPNSSEPTSGPRAD
jgi:hypothetical protein